MKYFQTDDPAKLSDDRMWDKEIYAIVGYLQAPVLDIGCGGRTLTEDTDTLDLNPQTNAMYVADASKPLPIPDGKYASVYTGHVIEHMQDPMGAIREWLRVIRPGGTLVIVCPDAVFTRGYNEDATPHWREWAPREFLAELLPELANGRDIDHWPTGFRPYWEQDYDILQPDGSVAYHIEAGPALPCWSFYVAITK